MTRIGPRIGVFPCCGLKCATYVLAPITASEAQVRSISRLYIIRFLSFIAFLSLHGPP